MPKHSLRNSMLQSRRQLTEAQVQHRSFAVQSRLQNLDVYRCADAVALYSSVHNEVSTASLLREILASRQYDPRPFWRFWGPATTTDVMTFPDGYRYEGEWRDGNRHGTGTASWPDGTEYTGTFVNGERHGEGAIVTPSGFRYEGEWVNGEMSGRGVATYANGDVYEGEFEDGKRSGTGTMRYASGEEASGNWQNGALQDDG